MVKTLRIWSALPALLVLSERAWAQAIPAHAHFFGGDGFGFGAMMFLGPLMGLLFIAAVVAVVVLLARWLGERQPPESGSSGGGRSPIDILRERFARGEIDKVEFDERRRILGD